MLSSERLRSSKNSNRIVVTSSLFVYLRPIESGKKDLVGLTGIEPVSDYPRKVVHRRGNSTGRLVVRNCAPDCALTGVYSRQTPSLTGKYGGRPLGGQVVETTAENVIRYVSTLLQRSAFQARLIDRSSISPFRINDLRTAWNSVAQNLPFTHIRFDILRDVNLLAERTGNHRRRIVSDLLMFLDHLRRFGRVVRAHE